MAVPFGFSVGDFIAAIGLVTKITQALQDSGGAASEYQSLTRDLANLKDALLKVDSAQAGNDTPVAGTILEQTSVVRKSAQELLDGLGKFEKRLGEQAETGWKHGPARKVQFAVFKSKEINKAKTIIHDQVQNLSVLNFLQILERVQRLDLSQQEMSQTISDKIDETKSDLQESVTQLSSVKNVQTDKIINEFKSSLEVLQSGMRDEGEHNLSRVKVLGDTIQDVLDRATVSSTLLRRNMDQEREELRVELNRLCGNLQALLNAVSIKWQQDQTDKQLSALDLKNTLLSSSNMIVESHTKLLQGLETRITEDLTSAFEKFGNITTHTRIREISAAHETNLGPNSRRAFDQSFRQRRGFSSAKRAPSESYVTRILEIIHEAFRSIWMTLVWVLPLLAGFLVHLRQFIPRQLPHLLENSIRFEDALGRVEFLPYKYFRHWEMFQAMLKCRFQGVPGQSNVEAGLYLILRARRPDLVISQRTWERSVMPGAHINMSILLTGVTSSNSYCPRCKSKCATSSTTVHCQECELEYYISSKADLEKRQDEIARTFLKLLGRDGSHVNTDASISRKRPMRRMRAATINQKVVDSESEDSGKDEDDYLNAPNKRQTSQSQSQNDTQDIEAFKRIHTFFEEEKASNVVQSSNKIWNTSTSDERERIKEFWLSLGSVERSSLMRVEKDAVLKKMKEQQKHSCSCTVCGQKRQAIENELETLYDSYYEQLVQYVDDQQDDQSPPMTKSPYGLNTYNLGHDQEHEGITDVEKDVEDDGGTEDEPHRGSPVSREDFFGFGNNLKVQGGIFTVSDDLLKNDGKRFIEIMEQLAERRMAREGEATTRSMVPDVKYPWQKGNIIELDDEDDYSDEEEEEYEDSGDEEYEEEEDVDTLTKEQLTEEGRRMFQIFAVRVFEQRVLTAYKEKVSRERQAILLEELRKEKEEEARRKNQRIKRRSRS